jgi:hypothetical protein
MRADQLGQVLQGKKFGMVSGIFFWSVTQFVSARAVFNQPASRTARRGQGLSREDTLISHTRSRHHSRRELYETLRGHLAADWIA